MAFDPNSYLKSKTAAGSAVAGNESDLQQAGETALQSLVLDPVEAIQQMGENAPLVGSTIKRGIPEVVRQWERDFEKRATATPAQRAGRIVGDIFNPAYLLAPELGLGRIGQFARLAPEIRSGIVGTLGGLLQPEEGDDFSWKEKGLQGLLGTIMGTTLGHFSSQHVNRQAVEAGNAAAKAAYDKALAAHQTNVQAADAANAAGKAAYQTALATHQRALGNIAQQNQALAQKHAQDLAAHQTTVSNIQSQNAVQDRAYQQALATHKGQVAQARAPTDFGPFNVERYRFILDKIGQGKDAPSTAGVPSLASIRTRIGSRLNDINSQFSYDPDTPGAAKDLEIIRAQVLAQITRGNLEPGIGRNRLTGMLKQWDALFKQRVLDVDKRVSGKQFAELITSLDKQADTIARDQRNSPDYADWLKMANGLHDAARSIEEHASGGTAELRAQRQQAREAYKHWSILNDASPPERGGIAKPSDVIRVWSNREGEAQYGQRYDADKANLERQRLSLEGPQAIPTAPVKPTAAPIPKPPTKPPDVPAPTAPTKPVKVNPGRAPFAPITKPVPGPSRAEAIAGKAPRVVGFALGSVPGAMIGHATGLPYGGTAGAGLGGAVGAGTITELGKLARLWGSRPGSVGAGAGQAVTTLPEIVITAKAPRPTDEDSQ